MTLPQTESKAEPTQFEHHKQHSLANLKIIEDLAAKTGHSLGRALFIAHQLVAHVHPSAPQFITRLEREVRHSDVREMASQAGAAWTNLRKYFRFEQLTADQKEQFYKRDGFLFFKHRVSRKLLVVWTTMFNNFFISNAAAVNLFGRAGCNILLLKDGSHFNYLKGVKGFAPDLFSIGPAIEELARRKGMEEIYMCGYSSSGYAALLTSLRIPCRGYLGFSQYVDLHAGSPLTPPYFFTEEVRSMVDPATTIDLKPLLAEADPSVPRTLFYGERNARDAAQGRHVEGMDTLEVIAMPTNHNTVLPFAAGDRLLPIFAKLLSG
ncbi:MAG: hypothetical protein R3E09_13180 [Novosphingobium sp.]|nr:hypothetical protein [Novosphingobium sp.]